MLVITTHNIEGKRMTKYHGMVSGEAILGANIFKDFFAGIRDIVGGRSAAYEKELRKAKDIAINEMIEAAVMHIENSIARVSHDDAPVDGLGSNLLLVSTSVSPVTVEKLSHIYVTLNMRVDYSFDNPILMLVSVDIY